MNDEERAFREGLQQAVADRPGGVRVDVDEVIARASELDFVGESRRTAPRWLAAAAALALVAGLGATVWFARTPAAIPAVPMAPVTSTPASNTDVASLELAGTKWRAIQIDGRSVQTVGGKAPSLEFVSATEVITSDGCNAGRRGYELKPIGVVLQFTFGLAGAQTDLGCNTAQQQRFDKALNVVIGARLSGETLEFLDPNDAVVLQFARADGTEPQPTQSPTGTPTSGFTVTISTPTDGATPTSPPSSTGAVYVRLYNDTSVTLHDVTVTYPDGVAIREATMAPGAYSESMSLEVAYRIASLEAKAGGRTYRVAPTDYVGEQPLKPGSYTYSIRLTEGVMFLEFGH